MKADFVSVQKPTNMLCGPACLDYLANKVYNLNVHIPNNLLWISELATFASTTLKFQTELSCYNSKLYDDFTKQSSPYDFDGFVSLANYTLQTSQSIKVKKYFKSYIDRMLNKDFFVLLNVSSAIFNNDYSMSGGHFILLLDTGATTFRIANPTSDSILIQDVSKKLIMQANDAFGNWMLTLKYP